MRLYKQGHAGCCSLWSAVAPCHIAARVCARGGIHACVHVCVRTGSRARSLMFHWLLMDAHRRQAFACLN